MADTNILFNGEVSIYQRGVPGSLFTSSAGVDTRFIPGAPDTIVRAGGNWITDGAQDDMYIYVSGSGANNGIYQINAGGVAALTLNVTPTAGLTMAAEGPNAFYVSIVDLPYEDGKYTAARWVYLCDDTLPTCLIEQFTDAPQGLMYALKSTVLTASKKFGYLQIVEQVNCQQLIGGAASLSFQAKTTGNAIRNIRAAVISWTGN